MIFDPKDDGITHINVYSKAKTELGKFLSNFSKTDLKTEDGDFQSVEGYWYFLQISDEYQFKNDLRNLSGKSAKEVGRLARENFPNYVDDSEFKRKIKTAIEYKIINSSFLKEFSESTLPFSHYYAMQARATRAYLMFGRQKFPDSKNDWVIEYLEEFRKSFK